MDETRRLALAAALGLPEDATPEQIQAEVGNQDAADQPADPPADPEDNPDDTETPAEPADPPATESGEGAESNAANASATVTMDRATFNRLKQGADAALAAQAQAGQKAVNDLIATKVEDGTIPPARRAHWTKAATADFDGTKEVLDSMESGLIPVQERGTGGGSEDVEAGNSAGFPDSWFPEITANRKAAEQQRPVLQAKEG